MNHIMQVETRMHSFSNREDAKEARDDEARRAEAATDGNASVSDVFPWNGGWSYLVEI